MSPTLTTSEPGGGFAGSHRPSRQHLQAGLLGAEQQRDHVDVLVRAGAHALRGVPDGG
jgi:hypothetical protein